MVISHSDLPVYGMRSVMAKASLISLERYLSMWSVLKNATCTNVPASLRFIRAKS